MSKSFRLVSLAAVLAFPALLSAQSRPIELGVDAGLTYRANSPHVTTIGIPLQDLRIGITVADKITLEPRGSLDYAKVQGSSAAWNLALGAGVLYHLNTLKSGPYFRPFATWNHYAVGSNSASQFSAGAGLGIKTGTGGVVGRFEAAYEHAFSNNNFAKSDYVVLLLGLSVFTK
jgi:hypothetical protein